MDGLGCLGVVWGGLPVARMQLCRRLRGYHFLSSSSHCSRRDNNGNEGKLCIKSFKCLEWQYCSDVSLLVMNEDGKSKFFRNFVVFNSSL